MSSVTILALYKFVSPKWDEGHVQNLKAELETFLRTHHVVGNLLLSGEGVNGTISYPSPEEEPTTTATDSIHSYFEQKFPGIRLRLSYDDRPVYRRLRIRIKKEIVTLGVADNDSVDPCHRVGEYVPPGPAWHNLLRDPHTLVIDTRNDYEVQLGTFENAENPGTTSFVEFPSWFQARIQEQTPQRIAMFCTGGIRCEKGSSYCLNHQVVRDAGIPVYHLEGGILAYLDSVPVEESLWRGECFVFDERTAVGHGLQPSQQFTLCRACRHPLSPTDRASPAFAEGVHCPYCIERQDKVSRRERYVERQKQCLLSEDTSVPHLHNGKLGKGMARAN